MKAEATGGREAIQSSPAGVGPSLLVTGLVDNPGEIDLARVQRLRAQTLTLTFTTPKKPARQRTLRGVWLIDLLHLARLQVDRTHPLSALSRFVVAMARDGAQVAFSLGELDRNLGAAEVLLCWSVDGKDLDEFRLVVGSDRIRRRSLNGLTRLEVCAAAVAGYA